ncbi:nickel ABC transporter permease subunit NikB [Fictibacillus phosphorivorans]|uniref:Nickel import system permease protein NikB n=1 Tax=Fictibacillus phosphorivorans TaxID=1221500 RepID=A0A160IMU2_9BACL|nr:nickel ABC transporter permease [Fictibacillus phosphorivorans]ANC77633.1 nickel ABC transporter permease subunit NikB [Fictibacillus phosphorivorans]
MLTIIKNRVTQLVVVLFILSLFTFTLMKMAPGDPVLTILNADEMVVTEEDQAELRKKLGFDQPLYIQYGKWMFNLVQLDLGKSYMSGKPVTEELLTRIPITAELTFFAMTIMLCITVPLGVWSAKYVNKWPDQFSRILALIGASIPNFWLGLILIYLFAFKLGVLPSSGIGSYSQIILPAFTLGFTFAVVYARLLRAGLLQSLSEDYIYAARARGVKEWRILWLHAFRAAVLPVLTIFGLSLGSFLGGAVVVEILFSWPGLGSLAVDAIFNRDYPVIQGYVLLTGVFVVLTNLLVDLSYYVIDPRMKRKEEAL